MEPSSSDRQRPVTGGIWLAWVVVAALTPVLTTIAATAFGKEVTPHATHRGLIMWGLMLTIVATLLAPPILQGLVLKRVFPKLRVGVWFLCVLLSCIVWLALNLSQHYAPHLINAGAQASIQLQTAAAIRRLGAPLTIVQLIGLPWAPFLILTIAVAALTSILPAVLLGAVSSLRRVALMAFVASIVGAVASSIVEQLYLMTIDYRPQWALNGLSWGHRLHILSHRASVGGVWGASTALVALLMMRPSMSARAARAPIFAATRAGGLAVALVAPLLIAVSAPFASYLMGPRGITAGVPELRKSLTLAPSQDRSQGETVLSYSHDIDVPVARLAIPILVPDGRSAILRTADHTWVQVDLATGKRIRHLAAGLRSSERLAIAWSADGRYMALRSDGAEVPIPKTHYKRHQTRVRIYALPDMALTGDFSNSEGTCFDSYAGQQIVFASDSKSLWVACGQYYTTPKPDELMAIQIEIPSMRLIDLRRYGDGAESGQAVGMDRIGDSVWVWQASHGIKPFRVRDLTRDRDVVTIPMPLDLIGKLTAQTNRHQVDEKTVRLQFHGAPPGTPDGAGPASWIYRTLTFDTRTGALLGSIDDRDHHVAGVGATSLGPQGTVSGNGVRIEAYWRADSKSGELVVRDLESGRERQRIHSLAQRPISLTADGQWLITGPVDGGLLRVYRSHR